MHPTRHPGPCPNCGHDLAAEDNFCSQCGQENHELKVPIGHLLYETVEGIFHFDNKFFSTIRAGLFSPGKLTVDFLEGRRARYVPPIRLYVFVTFLLSVLLSFIPTELADVQDQGSAITFNSGSRQLKERPVRDLVRKGIAGMPLNIDAGKPASQILLVRTAAAQLRRGITSTDTAKSRIISEDSLALVHDIAGADETEKDTLVWRDGKLVLLKRVAKFPVDSAGLAILHTKNSSKIDSMANAWGAWPMKWQTRLALKRLGRISEGKNSLEAGVKLQTEGYMKTFFKSFFASMFILMPLVAFLLWLMYRKHRPFYYEHLIFSVHTHAILFLIISIFLGARLISQRETIDTIINGLMIISIVVYFPIALRRVYPSTWGRYFLKLSILALLYGSLTIVFVGLGALYSLLTF